MTFTKIPIFVRTVVLEVVVDNVEVVRLLQEQDQFPFAQNLFLKLIPGHFFCQTRLEIRACGSKF